MAQFEDLFYHLQPEGKILCMHMYVSTFVRSFESNMQCMLEYPDLQKSFIRS